jgi:transposase
MDQPQDGKSQTLREHAALNLRPKRVIDPLFQHSEFFDPRDLVQVKYEMLRRVRVEQRPASAAAKAFGFSRVAFYQAMAAYQNEGLPGLLPRRRGPKQGHKLTVEVLKFIDQCRAGEGNLRPAELAGRIRERLGVSVHPRSIERALARRAKKGRHIRPS